MALRLLILLILCASPLSATDWYVDNAASGSNNGTSWTNAWQSFATIIWGGAGAVAGDTLYISGGTTSKTYNETLSVGASGSSGSGYIYIKVGQASPHNGTVIIDKQWANYYCISISNLSYIDISGQVGSGTSCNIYVTHSAFSGISISGTIDHINLSYMEVTACGDRATTMGLRMDAVENAALGEIHHCKFHDNPGVQVWLMRNSGAYNSTYGSLKFHHNEVYNSQEDFINGSLSGMDFYNNTMHTRITAFDNYSDIIQWTGRYFRWFNNTTYRLARDYNTVQPTAWQAKHTYRYGDLISPTGANATKRYLGDRTTATCVSGDIEPSWDFTAYAHTADGSCDWESYMVYANDDGTWWPSDWAVNAHVKYSPDGGPGHDPDPTNIEIFNNLAYETDLPRCYTGGCTGARFFELSLADSTLTSVAHVRVLNNTLVGSPLNAITLGFNATETVNDILIENNIIQDCGGMGDPTNNAPLQFSPMNGNTIGNHGSAATLIVDYNTYYASSAAYSTLVLYDTVVHTLAQFMTDHANANGSVNTPNLNGNYQSTASTPNGTSEAVYFTTDILGVTRSVWTLGAYEYAGASSGASGSRIRVRRP